MAAATKVPRPDRSVLEAPPALSSSTLLAIRTSAWRIVTALKSAELPSIPLVPPAKVINVWSRLALESGPKYRPPQSPAAPADGMPIPATSLAVSKMPPAPYRSSYNEVKTIGLDGVPSAMNCAPTVVSIRRLHFDCHARVNGQATADLHTIFPSCCSLGPPGLPSMIRAEVKTYAMSVLVSRRDIQNVDRAAGISADANEKAVDAVFQQIRIGVRRKLRVQLIRRGIKSERVSMDIGTGARR